MATLGQGQPDIASLASHTISWWKMGREAIMCVVIVGVLMIVFALLAPFAYVDSKLKGDA